MKKLLEKLNSKRGALTIEATIALTSFLFMFIMIYSIVTICRFQATVQMAINSTAKEISQYSYLYSISGVYDAMNNLQESADATKTDTNELVGNVADVFAGIQSIGGTEVSFDSVDSIMNSWDELSGKLDETEASMNAAKEKIAEMTKDPQQLLFGMAKLFASEGYELVKSAVAEAASRVLTQKNLIRSNDDTAEAYCKAMGVVPGTYFGSESYFNGIDFSHSTLFAYGSDEIRIVANYEIKLLQLLPIDFTFHITQTAVTKGWLQGDGSVGTAKEILEEAINERGDSIWNTATPSEREKLIRHQGIADLKDSGYYGVSGQTYIHAYTSKDNNNTMVMIRSYNPLAGVNSVSEVDKTKVKEYLQKLESQLISTTDNMHTIKVKKQDANGNLITEEVNCTGEKTLKIIVVIPQDKDLDVLINEVIAQMGPKVEFEVLPSYGTVFNSKKQDTTATDPESGSE